MVRAFCGEEKAANIMDLYEMQLPDHHQDIIDRFVAACQADDRIVAAFLAGSYAKGTADKFSDLDLFLVTTDEAYEDFLVERKSFIRLLGQPLLIEDFDRVSCIIFDNAEVDIWFGCESKLQDISCGPYKVLLDKNGILADRAFQPRVADQAKQIELLHQQIDEFWHELSHFIKAMGRRQLWFAYGQIEAMRQICVVLARLRYNFSDAYIGGEEPYFKIEQALPVEELSPLQTTFCPMAYDAMLQTALVICRFYRDVALNLAKAYNLTFQTDLERMMASQLEALGDVGLS